MENHLGELWSLMQFALPGLLGTDTTFKRVFRDPIERHGSPVMRDMLSKRIKPLLLRRTKSTVEERMLELQKRKRILANMVNESTGAGLRFSKEDIEQLLAPVGC